MKQLQKIYHQYNKVISNGIFPLVLFLYPFLTIDQGIDVSDSTYSLTNFLFFDRMEGMWVTSTYVSNVAGWLMTKLPMGTTILGVKVYATLFVSGTALLVYFMFIRWMPAWIAFLGEVAAIGFCWIPAGILYNYLTYFFFTLGAILLYQGLVEEKDSLLAAAGVVLGLNVFVRIPNLTQMALIVGLWYYLAKKHKKAEVLVKKTGVCLAGYLAGAALPLAAVWANYGFSGIEDMLQGLSGIQNTDETYSIWSMIFSVINAYQRTFLWGSLILIGVAMGTVMFFLARGRLEFWKKAVYVLGMLVLLRFLWGRGMFSFRYYEDYTSIFEWGMLGLYLIWIAAFYMLISHRNSLEEKLWAVIVMAVVAVTPLGSNNYTMQNLNNLFLAMPFALYTYVKIFRRKGGNGILMQITFPWKAMLVMLGFMILVQSIGFHSQFVFRDGMDGSKREYRFREPEALAGMKTTKENGEALAGLTEYMETMKKEGQEVILYGDCPGLSFILNMPFAIGTAWPDLDSYPYETFVRDLEELDAAPTVIIRKTEPVGEQSRKKKEYLLDHMKQFSYENVYSNETYEVYMPAEAVLP